MITMILELPMKLRAVLANWLHVERNQTQCSCQAVVDLNLTQGLLKLAHGCFWGPI